MSETMKNETKKENECEKKILDFAREACNNERSFHTELRTTWQKECNPTFKLALAADIAEMHATAYLAETLLWCLNVMSEDKLSGFYPYWMLNNALENILKITGTWLEFPERWGSCNQVIRQGVLRSIVNTRYGEVMRCDEYIAIQLFMAIVGFEFEKKYSSADYIVRSTVKELLYDESVFPRTKKPESDAEGKTDSEMDGCTQDECVDSPCCESVMDEATRIIEEHDEKTIELEEKKMKDDFMGAIHGLYDSLPDNAELLHEIIAIAEMKLEKIGDGNT